MALKDHLPIFLGGDFLYSIIHQGIRHSLLPIFKCSMMEHIVFKTLEHSLVWLVFGAWLRLLIMDLEP